MSIRICCYLGTELGVQIQITSLFPEPLSSSFYSQSIWILKETKHSKFSPKQFIHYRFSLGPVLRSLPYFTFINIQMRTLLSTKHVFFLEHIQNKYTNTRTREHTITRKRTNAAYPTASISWHSPPRDAPSVVSQSTYQAPGKHT